MKTSTPQSAKVWIAGGAAAAAALVALGWFAAIGPELSGTTALRSQTADVQAQNSVLLAKVNRLRAQNEQLPILKTQFAVEQAALPADSGLPDYTRQLIAEASTAGVNLTGISAGTPVVATSGSAAAAPVAAGNAAGHLFAIPMNVIGDGTLKQQEAFVKAVQQDGARRALITSVQFVPPSNTGASSNAVTSVDKATTMTMLLQVFVAPQTPAAEALLRQQMGTGSR